jgi:hypothetical protein
MLRPPRGRRREQHAISAHPCSRRDASERRCATMFENTHRTILREMLYPHGRLVLVPLHIKRAQDGSLSGKFPPGCSTERPVLISWLRRTKPFVSLDGVAALATLLSFVLKGSTGSSNAPLSGAWISRDQNRREARVIQGNSDTATRGSPHPVSRPPNRSNVNAPSSR